MTDLTCEQFQALSPELALGVAEARQRAAALSHLERCPVCRADLRHLSDVADLLAALTPQAEPPAGFESRVLARLRQPPQRPALARRVARAAAAVVVAAVLGAGGWMMGVSQRSSNAGHAVTAAFTSKSGPVGQFMIDSGDDPWVSMAVEMPDVGDEPINCQVRTQDGRFLTVGSFILSRGHGYWAAPVPAGVGAVNGARLIDDAGRVVAVATIR